MALDKKMRTVELTLDLIRETDGAYIVESGGEEIVLPKSLTERSGSDPREFIVAEWLAEDRGLI